MFNTTDLVDHAGVGGIVLSGDKKVLLLWHNKFARWSLPVGKAEPGEDTATALCRELLEEVNVIVDEHSVKLLQKCPMTYQRQGHAVKVCHHIYLVEAWKGTPINMEPEKHALLRWVTIAELAELKESSLTDATILGRRFLSALV